MCQPIDRDSIRAGVFVQDPQCLQLLSPQCVQFCPDNPLFHHLTVHGFAQEDQTASGFGVDVCTSQFDHALWEETHSQNTREVLNRFVARGR